MQPLHSVLALLRCAEETFTENYERSNTNNKNNNNLIYRYENVKCSDFTVTHRINEEKKIESETLYISV